MRRDGMKETWARKGMCTLFVTVGLLTAFSFSATAGQWIHDGVGWWFQNGDGSYPSGSMYDIGGVYYVFNGNGYMLENQWVKMGDDWYYCAGDGAVAQNQWIGDYYVGSSGAMYTNAWTPDGYYVDAGGKWVPGAGQENGSSSSGGFTRDWIFGRYDNVNEGGFSTTHRVDLEVRYDEDGGYEAVASFGLYDALGSTYSLYDQYNPNGDILYLYTSDNRTFYGKSEISGEEYRLEYDGVDTIKIEWRSVIWHSGNRVITFKKTQDYYVSDYGYGVG